MSPRRSPRPELRSSSADGGGGAALAGPAAEEPQCGGCGRDGQWDAAPAADAGGTGPPTQQHIRHEGSQRAPATNALLLPSLGRKQPADVPTAAAAAGAGRGVERVHAALVVHHLAARRRGDHVVGRCGRER